MVSFVTTLCILFSFTVSLIVPLLLGRHFIKKYGVNLFTMMTGVGIFIVFSLILERILHAYILQINTHTASYLNSHPWGYALYGAFAAGIFEEVGRFIGFLFIIKDARKWSDGIGYGIGHGGVEAILLGGLNNLNLLIASIMIDLGIYHSIGSGLTLSEQNLKTALIDSSSYIFLVSGVERVVAFTFQIGLSLVILLAVINIGYKRYLLLMLAILLHVIMDIPAALFQKGACSLWFTEIYALVLAILSFVFIIYSKRKNLFKKSEEIS